MRTSIPFKRILIAAAFMAAVLFVVAAIVVWRDPYAVVRAEFDRARLFAGLSQGTLRAGGHRWAYAHRDAPASAPTVVLLHGYTGSKENWYPVASALDGRYRLLVPDLPGWGQSQREADADYGYVAQTARVAAFIRAASPRTPVVLVGHSMGGGIAGLVAARHPQLVSRVALVSASGVRFKDNRFGEQVLAGHNPFGVTDARTLSGYMGILFQDERAKPWVPWPVSEIVIARRRHDAAFEQGVLDRIGRSEESFLPWREAARIRQPALLLWCRQDKVIDASAMDLYGERIPQARKVLLDGCGHMPLMERPAEVADALRTLIEEGTPR